MPELRRLPGLADEPRRCRRPTHAQHPDIQELPPLVVEREDRVFFVGLPADPPAPRAFGRPPAAGEDARVPDVFGEDAEFFLAALSGRISASARAPTMPR